MVKATFSFRTNIMFTEIFYEHWKIKHTNKNLNLNNLSIIENYFRYTKLKCTYPKNI